MYYIFILCLLPIFKYMKFITLFIILFFQITTSAYSQELNLININTDMGLPSNECYRVAQDKKGYIWISTELGLVKYNSKEFVLFDKNKGMPSNNVYALDIDTTSGKLWFATGNWDVGYIQNDSVTVLNGIDFHFTMNKFISVFDVIYKIKYNYTNKSLFVSSHHNTIEIVKYKNKFISRVVDSSGYPRDFLLLTNKDWSYTANLYKYDRNYSKEKLLVHLVLNNKDSLILPVTKNTLFTESFSVTDANNTCIFSITNFLLAVSKKATKTISFPSQIQSLYKDSENNIWVGCKKGGVFLIQNGNLNIKPIHFLNTLSISNILEDKEGGLWFTTLENGIYFCSNRKSFLDFNDDKTASNISFLKVENENLFVNNGNTDLTIISSKTIKRNMLWSTETTPKVTGLISTPNGYILCTNRFTYQLNNSFKIISSVTLNNYAMGGSGILKTTAGKIYLINNSGFYTISENKIKLPDIINPFKIKDAIVTKKDNILFCSKSTLYEIRNNVVVKTKFNDSINKLNINKLYSDSYNNIWLSTNSDTLLILDSSYKLKSKVLLLEKSISCKNILQISPLSFFVCTNNGLIEVSFKNTSLKDYELLYFNKTNGLPSNDIYDIVKFQDKFYVSTPKGVCIFNDPQEFKLKVLPNTVINKISVNDKGIIASGNLILSYNQNNLSFQVDALAFKKINQRGVFYKYRLAGFENEFKLATGNTVTYNNLPPGKYTFIAKTFYDNNTEDDTPAEFSFTIKPAVWQTWWGILLIILLIATCIFLFIQWRIKKFKQIEKEKAAINQTIAEYKFTALKAQMNPHFVFNSINVIQNLILEKDKTEAYNSLSKFSRLIRMILNQSDSAFATIEEELALIKMYVELNQLRIEYPFTYTTEIEQDLLFVSIPSLIIQPFIENAFWHGILPYKGEKEGVITLKIFKENTDVIVIEIKDNGIGRKAALVKKPSLHVSKGINLIEERLKAYRAMHNNCLAQLTFFDLEENGVASGTLVQIKIEIKDEE